jgi:hypothetical protein
MFDLDGVGFGAQGMPSSVDGSPEAFAAAVRAYPNPTAGAATVAFDLAEASDVRAEVLDVLGRRVATLAQGPAAAGPVRLAVPALSPGLYFVRVQTAEGTSSARLTVTR